MSLVNLNVYYLSIAPTISDYNLYVFCLKNDNSYLYPTVNFLDNCVMFINFSENKKDVLRSIGSSST